MNVLAAIVLSTAPLLAAISSPAPAPDPSPTLYAEAAIIAESASTNTAARRVMVWPDGRVIVTRRIVGGPWEHVDLKLASTLFADLQAAAPLDRLTSGGCMKSASFGTTLTVTWHGTHSPDLSCPGGKPEERLAADAHAILDVLRFDAPPVRGGTPSDR